MIQEQSFFRLRGRQVCKRILHFFQSFTFPPCERVIPVVESRANADMSTEENTGAAMLPSQGEPLESAPLKPPVSSCGVGWGLWEPGAGDALGPRKEPRSPDRTSRAPFSEGAEVEAQTSPLLLLRVQADARIRLPH